MLRLIIKEYINYIKENPQLIKRIPKRLWEEFFLHAQYNISILSGSKRNGSLIKDLHEMSNDMDSAEEIYKPSLLWKDLLDQFERVLHVEEIQAFKTQRYNRRFSAFAPTDPVIYKMFLWLYWNDIKKRDTLNLLKKLEEPDLGKPDFYKINEKKMSLDLLQSLDEFYSIHPYMQNRNQHIITAELGAGYGRLGYVFLNAIPKSTYIVIDLPGSLIIAQYYLTRIFKKEKILTYRNSKKVKKLDFKTLSQYKIVFLAPWQLSLLENKTLDIFINIYSFQEMTMKQINNYFEIIGKKTKGLFYNKQYFISENPKDSTKIALKDYPVKRTWKKLYEKPSSVHQLSFEALYRIPKK